MALGKNLGLVPMVETPIALFRPANTIIKSTPGFEGAVYCSCLQLTRLRIALMAVLGKKKDRFEILTPGATPPSMTSESAMDR